jgi:hypothetical protein
MNLPNIKESPRLYWPRSILPTRMAPGSAGPTKIPTGYYDRISLRALTLRGSLKLKFGGLKIDSITDPEKHGSFDLQTISFNTVNHKH